MSSRNKSNYESDKSRKRSRSRSRDRDRDFSRDTNKTRDRSERREKDNNKRSGRWTDAPSMSRFSNAPSNYDNSDKPAFNSNPNNYPTKPTAAYGSGSNVNPNILFTLNDNTKIKRKIYIPKVSGVNFVGLLIGPKGSYQKRLEQQSSCKILIRGKGTQKDGMPPQADDNEEQHVLIVGETEENVNRAKYLIEKVLYSDDHTRNRIKEEQLKASQEMRTELFLSVTDAHGKPIPQEIEDYLMTPYGPPDRNARILPVPNDSVGLIIGKNGETIRRLHRETGCKIQIAKKEIPNTDVRNVFIEGPPEKYEIAKRLIEEIIAEQIFLKQNFSHLGEINPFPGPHTPLRIPNKMVGLIIGKNGETVKTIHQKTGCFIFIPKESRMGEEYRELELSGTPDSVEICKREIISMIHMALYGRLPYQNSLFYPYIDPTTGLPIIDPGIMAQLDPNSKKEGELASPSQQANETLLSIPSGEQADNTSENDHKAPENASNLDKQIKNNTADVTQNVQQMPALEYKYAPANFSVNNSNFLAQQELISSYNQHNYNLYDYNDQSNYDLYYQSLYQMYPQMSDYQKKAEQNSFSNTGVRNQSTPFVLFNTSLFEENNAMYDPNMINTNLLDVNFQNKFAFSTEQYFEGKMFDQNYSDYESASQNPSQNTHQSDNSEVENRNKFSKDNEDKINHDYEAKKNEDINAESTNNRNHSENQAESNKAQDEQKPESFKIPENLHKNKDGEKKRRSKFDQ